MSIKRDLHLGNTEESFWFCPEEILYMQAVTNEKETKVVLLNNECYFVPQGLGSVVDYIKDALKPTDKVMMCIGRDTIFNRQYFCGVVDKGTIRLMAEVDGQQIETTIQASDSACKHLKKTRGMNKEQLRDYLENHSKNRRSMTILSEGHRFPDFRVNSRGLTHALQRGDNEYLGFTIRPDAQEDYYDINDDEIMFLGV